MSTEWDVLETGVNASLINDNSGIMTSTATFEFRVRRRPFSFLYTVLLPAVLLSVLNFFVYVIPVEAGEKISYGITVFLAQSFLLTTVTSRLPASTGPLTPATVYLLVLLSIQVVTVIASIVVVYCYNMDQGNSTCKQCIHRETDDVKLSTGENQTLPNGTKVTSDLPGKLPHTKSNVKHWTAFGKWINFIGFVVCILAWLAVTVWFTLTALS